MKILNENISKNILCKLNESDNFNTELKSKLLDWSKDKDLYSLNYYDGFTSWAELKGENESNENLIDKFFKLNGNKIEIISEIKYEESDTKLKANFKVSAILPNQYEFRKKYTTNGEILADTVKDNTLLDLRKEI